MRTQNRITDKHKELIVKEYLRGNMSYASLALKHGVSHTAIYNWVKGKTETELSKEPKKASIAPQSSERLPTDIKKLQEELRLARLENELLNAMIDIAQDQLKIDIRKKSGTKR